MRKGKMNIAFITFSAKAGAGISVFQNLLPVIGEIDNYNNYFVFLSEEQEEIIKFLPEKFNKILIKNLPKNPYLRVLWEQIFMPFYLKKHKIDLLYSVGNSTILLSPCKVLLFIENPNPFSKIIKDWSLNEKIRNRLLYLLTYFSAKKADKIRFCSYRSRDIICDMLKIDKNKTFVLYHGLNDQWKRTQVSKNPFPFDYILSVSVVAPHKNFEVLIEAYSILKKQYNYNGKLVIVGDTCYPEYFNKLLSLIKKLSLVDDIVFTGKISNIKLIDYYQNCDLFIFPSLEETFGIPLIEALSLGCLVLASDGERYKELFIPFNELGGNKVIYFDPYSPEDLVNKVIYVWENRENLKDIVKIEFDEFREKYNIKSLAKKLVEEFNNILTGVQS